MDGFDEWESCIYTECPAQSTSASLMLKGGCFKHTLVTMVTDLPSGMVVAELIATHLF